MSNFTKSTILMGINHFNGNAKRHERRRRKGGGEGARTFSAEKLKEKAKKAAAFQQPIPIFIRT